MGASCSRLSKGILPVSGNSPNEPLVSIEEAKDWKAVHSAIRWNKEKKVKAFLEYPITVNCLDEKNGNAPIHIAAQNGHLEILKLLIDKNAKLDLQNNKGNTALHMAVGYDYFECAKVLIEAGAKLDILNQANFPAKYGLDGDKTLALIELISAERTKNPTKIMSAFESCKSQNSDLNIAAFTATGLRVKKELGENWTADMQTIFLSIVQS